jgi:protein disulfide-isomerase
MEAVKPGNWTVDCRAALAQAKQEKRRVFLLFTGSDWSAFSQRFHKEILSSPEFARYAIDNLVLVMIDFPKTFTQPEALKSQNNALMKAFKIERLPMVVILNSEGKPLGLLPFEEGGPANFIDSLKKL